MIGAYFGAQLGAYLKEKHRTKCYQSFVDLLGRSRYVFEPLERCFVASLPVTIYNNAFSTPKSYIVVLTNGVYLDLKPSSKEDPSRIAALNKRTIQHLELVQPSIWEKMNILGLSDYVRITFAHQAGNSLDMHLFSDLPGERTLTMDPSETLTMHRFLREVKITSQIKPLNR